MQQWPRPPDTPPQHPALRDLGPGSSAACMHACVQPAGSRGSTACSAPHHTSTCTGSYLYMAPGSPQGIRTTAAAPLHGVHHKSCAVPLCGHGARQAGRPVLGAPRYGTQHSCGWMPPRGHYVVSMAPGACAPTPLLLGSAPLPAAAAAAAAAAPLPLLDACPCNATLRDEWGV